MQQIVPDIYWLEELRGCNVYLIDTDSELTLVDCGYASDAKKIAAQIQKSNFALNDLTWIVLTHCHGDHVGGAVQLARLSGAQIVAFQSELPYIELKKTVPVTPLSKRIIHWLGNRTIFRIPGFKVDRAVRDLEILDGSGKIQVIHSPGHTPGSMSIFLPDRKILFCGDALFNVNPITGSKGLRFPIPLFTMDVRQARDSVKKLSELQINVLCCGHGKPVFDASAKMSALF